MSTAGAVLGVIRASRPTLRTPVDRAAFAVHATFLAAGYSLVATGTKANSSVSVSGRDEESEVGSDGWDEIMGAYAFRYRGSGQYGLLDSVTVKCMAMGDSLMIDAVSNNVDTPVHVEIKASNYAAEGDLGNYGQQYSNLEGLVNVVNSSILGKLSPKKPAEKEKTSTRDGWGSQEETSGLNVAGSRNNEVEQQSRRRPETGSSLIDDRQRSGGPGFMYPQVPAYGGSDLYPSQGAGIFGPRQDGNYGGPGMLVGPNDPRWGAVGAPRPGFSTGGVPDADDLFVTDVPIFPYFMYPDHGGGRGVPPGARFDPYGPPGVPGFEPSRFTRDPRRSPGGHPDLEHFSNDF